jgi:hypothetical protein
MLNCGYHILTRSSNNNTWTVLSDTTVRATEPHRQVYLPIHIFSITRKWQDSAHFAIRAFPRPQVHTRITQDNHIRHTRESITPQTPWDPRPRMDQPTCSNPDRTADFWRRHADGPTDHTTVTSTVFHIEFTDTPPQRAWGGGVVKALRY